MTDIKLFQMGFGESILLSDRDQCLLVDCGSESTAKHAYFDNVRHELEAFSQRKAMITHFHEDHINGFMEIIKTNPHLFNTVYIPHVFSSEHPNLTDLEITAYLLNQIYCPGSKTLTIWELLKQLSDKSQRVQLLQRGKSAFSGAGDLFDVLWPIPDKVVSKRLANLLRSNIPDEFWQEITALSDQITNGYLLLQSRQGELAFEEVTDGVERRLGMLSERYGRGLRQAFSKEVAAQAVKAIRSNANRASIVCHNHSQEKTVLLTGDAPDAVLKKIAGNTLYPNVPLKNKYHVLKVPHHGTNTHYFNFGCHTVFDQLMISNGPADSKNRGMISRQYNLLSRDYKIVCTNTSPKRCQCICQYPYTACGTGRDICGCVYPRTYLSV